MMRIFTLLTFLMLSFSGYAQTNSVNVVTDTNYYYRDTVNKKAYLGSYKPTGLIQAPDDALIISNELSIDFPEMYDNSKPNMEYKKFLEYEAHLHVSSGSIFRLNNQYKKDWEIVLKDKRVEQIKAFDDTSFIAAGDNIHMRKIWVARMRLADGKILWFKEFSIRHQSTIDQLRISFSKDIIVLSENKRIIPISIRKQNYKTRILLFKKSTDFEYLLSLSSLSCNGELNWTRTVDFKNRYDFESYGMAVDTNINILASYNGFEKMQGKHIKREGENGYVHNLKGHKLMKKSLIITQNGLSVYENGWVFVNIKSDSISVEKLDTKMKRVLYNVIKLPIKYDYIQSLSFMNGAYYLYGVTDRKRASHLICKFDTNLNLLNSWTYYGVLWNNIAQWEFDSQGRLIILGNCSKFTNLVKLELQ